MRCKYARRTGSRQERWKVTLYWQGRKWTRYRYDDRVPLSSEFLAQRLAHAINSEIERLGPGFSPRSWFSPSSYELRLDNYARAWLDRKTELAPESYKQYHTAIETYIVPILGTLDIRRIKLGHLEDFLNRLPAELSPATKRQYLRVISGILHDAHRRQDLDHLPAFPTVRVPEREIPWITFEQRDKVLDCIPSKHQPIFRVTAYYGLRPAEARALMWDCVDFEKKTLTIRRCFSQDILRETTKSNQVRTLPLTEEVEEILRPMRGVAGFVFRDRNGAYKGNALRLIWNSAIKKAGVKQVTLYEGMKHSTGQGLYRQGWDIESLKQLFGHRSEKTLSFYVRQDTEGLRDLLRLPKKTR